MEIGKATVKDLPMLRKMEAVAQAQIARAMSESRLDPDTQLELMKVRLRIEELEQTMIATWGESQS